MVFVHFGSYWEAQRWEWAHEYCFFPSILHHKYLSLFRKFFILTKHQLPKRLSPLLLARRRLNSRGNTLTQSTHRQRPKEIYLSNQPISGDPKKSLSLSLSLSQLVVGSLSSKFKHFTTIGFVSRRLMCCRVVNQVWVWD